MLRLYSIVFASVLAAASVLGEEGHNVLFIAVDDLRPALGCYGDEVAVTPHLDALAARGTVFVRAYCQEAVCNPSRASLLTGRYPDTTRVWDLSAHFRDALPDVVTLPQAFKEGGYRTIGVGKILHGSGRASVDEVSWTEPTEYHYVRAPELRYALPRNLEGKGLKRDASESADVEDGHYTDGVVAARAIERLGELAAGEKPFFLAVGYRKPHLPFCAPQRYWDLYDEEAIPAVEDVGAPFEAPEWATRSWMELEGYRDIPKDGGVTAAQVRRLRHGYYACVSYVDALIGGLLGEMDRLGLRDDTIVVVWGDHGFHLGEQSLWTKSNNYELSTRVPLIVSAPGQQDAGAICEALVELVDVYPTLVEWCDMPMPEGLEGRSLVPLLNDADMEWADSALSQFPRAREGNRHKGHGSVMGYSLRTDRYRYVEWRDLERGGVEAVELYDHKNDAAEMRNLVNDPEKAAVLRAHAEMLETRGVGMFEREARK
ncbi:MAG: sulfatase [Verrucomicrobiota bacterium]